VLGRGDQRAVPGNGAWLIAGLSSGFGRRRPRVRNRTAASAAAASRAARHATPHPPVAWLHIDAPDCQRTLRFAWHQSTYLSTAARLFRDYSAQRLRLDTAST
jgi:DNA-binding transcriptional LysR family regulator